MCGLVGVYNSIPLVEKELSIFQQLLYSSALRGEHSTGLMLVTTESVFDYIKTPDHPADFIAVNFDPFVDKHKGKILGLFGHTRFATSGKINTRNAHPFAINKEIIMMHNGNVMSVPEVNVKDFQVDSMALATALHKHQNPKDVFSKFFGAAAVFWFDVRNNTFNIYRNHERTLSVANGNYGANFLASEGDMLRWILGRSGLGHLKVESIDTEKIYSFDLKEQFKNLETIKVPFVLGGSGRQTTYGTTTTTTIRNHFTPKIVQGSEDTKPATEKPYLLINSYGPFEKGDTLLACPEAVEHIGDGNFRIVLTPLALNWTDEHRSKYGNTKCFVFVVGKHKDENIAFTKQIEESPVVEVTIKSIRYMRNLPKEQRVTLFCGDPQLRNGAYQ